MFGIKVVGRLGNQMFQMAFVYYLSKQHNVPYILLKNKARHQRFNLNNYFTLTGFHNVFNFIGAFFFKRAPTKNIFIQSETHPDLEKKKIPKKITGITFNGFLQSELFFPDFKDELSRLFSIKKKCRIEFKKEYGEIFSQRKIITIHIRLTDYADANYCLPSSYYFKCLERIPNLKDYTIIVVSDDIKKAKEIFKERNDIIYSHHSEIIDFQIILNSDIAIISNSSFSWWAAYLSEKTKDVYAPKKWLNCNKKTTKEYPIGVIPSDWHKIK